MDKFELEQLQNIKSQTEDLQRCFIDEDAYSREPDIRSWRKASRIVRDLILAVTELTGYASAMRTISMQFTRERLQIVTNEKNSPLPDGKRLIF